MSEEAQKSEYDEIFRLIKSTPRNSKEIVENYHKEVIERLDSRALLEIPGWQHRILHQQMWFVTFSIYNGYPDFNSATLDFGNCPSKDSNGEYSSERRRFEVFYLRKYVFPNKHLLKNEQTIEWVKGITDQVRDDVTTKLYRPLEDLVFSLD